jgi:hypothetical protein
MPAEPVPVTPPKHPLPALTSYELRDYRWELERAIRGISPDAPVQSALRAKLDAVVAEQDDRARMAADRSSFPGGAAARPGQGRRTCLPARQLWRR